MLHCNVNGLCNKVNTIRDTLNMPDCIDLFLVSETHLTSTISNAAIQIPGYEVIRNDSGESSKHGVCAFIRDGIKFDNVDFGHNNVLGFRLTSLNVYVYVIYRPPSNSVNQNDGLIMYLQDRCADKETVLMGDFNLPTVDWTADSISTTSASDRKFLDLFDSLGLTQWIQDSTFPRSGNTLDLILSTEADRIGNAGVLPPPPGCDHCAIHCEYIFDKDIENQSSPSSHRLWHRGNYVKLCEKIRDTNWDELFAQLTAHQAFEKLRGILAPLIEECVPCCDSTKKRNKVPWKANPPTSLKRRRREAWNTYKQSKSMHGKKAAITIQSLGTFLDANHSLRYFAVHSQIEYEKSLIVRAKDNPKLLHSYIRHKKTYRSSVGPLSLQSGDRTDDPEAMANCFCAAFASVYTAEVPARPAPHQQCEAALENIDFTVEDVRNVLSGLDSNSAMGPDGLHPYLLKACAASLAYPLFCIFYSSLQEGILPALWKISNVVPIFKKGSRYDPLNYRPISLTSVPCKCQERLLFRGLYNFLDENNILDNAQFGFRPGRSTDDQLLLTYTDVSQGLDQGHIVDLILFDFRKAFDVVCHTILLDKLKCLGIQGHVLAWLQDFLVERTMRVIVKGASSVDQPVLSGVPQGSVLGPVLFLIYINHIASALLCNYKIFADDLKIYMCLTKSNQDVPARIQADIACLHATAESWGLKMNTAKCAVLRFQRRFHTSGPPAYILDGEIIPHVSNQSDLGVLVDDELKFHDHCSTIARKAGGVAHNFLKSTLCRSPDFMLHILTTHIRPIIEYASTVWHTGYHQDLKKLEAVQRLWTRNILDLRDAEYEERLKSLNLFSVKGRLLRADLIKCWKIFNGKSMISPNDLWDLNLNPRLRGHKFKICVRRSQIDARSRFFTDRIVNNWNSLPIHICS